MMTILQGSANIEMIKTELRTLFGEKINWEVSQMASDKEFMILFPDDDKRQ